MGSSPIVSTILTTEKVLVTTLRPRVSGGFPGFGLFLVPLPCHNGEGSASWRPVGTAARTQVAFALRDEAIA